MVRGVERLDGTVVGVHVTYLSAADDGKADISSPKKLHTIARGASRGAAIQLAEPIGGVLGLAEGIEVFPKHNQLQEGEFGNAIRGPLGVHRGANRRYWFYGAD